MCSSLFSISFDLSQRLVETLCVCVTRVESEVQETSFLYHFI